MTNPNKAPKKIAVGLAFAMGIAGLTGCGDKPAESAQPIEVEQPADPGQEPEQEKEGIPGIDYNDTDAPGEELPASPDVLNGHTQEEYDMVKEEVERSIPRMLEVGYEIREIVIFPPEYPDQAYNIYVTDPDGEKSVLVADWPLS